MTVFARPFNITNVDGQTIHAVQFPDGRYVFWSEGAGYEFSPDFDGSDMDDGTVIEWAPGTEVIPGE